ncbi:MAG: fumarylacetoacetate hydrolase family protein [Thiohalomonadales bacterium]
MNSVYFNNQSIFPSKIICVGRNYHDHIVELNNPVPDEIIIFNKPNSSISNEIKYIDKECNFETELSFMIMDNKISGIAIGFDITKRNLQNKLKSKGLPWERAKSFDGSAVFTKFVATDFLLDNINFILLINNKIQQQGSIKQMINTPTEIVDYVKTFMSLCNGDIVMTGTPKGVSTYNKNDHFHVKLLLENDVLIEQKWLVK